MTVIHWPIQVQLVRKSLFLGPQIEQRPNGQICIWCDLLLILDCDTWSYYWPLKAVGATRDYGFSVTQGDYFLELFTTQIMIYCEIFMPVIAAL